MKEAVHQHLFQIRLEQFLRQHVAVHVQLRDGAQRGDLGAADIIHRQHAARTKIKHGQRHEDVRKLLQVGGQRGQIGRLALIIQLLQDGALELREDLPEPIAAADVRVGVEKVRDLLQHLKIFRDLFADVRALHFYDHGPPVAQGRAMHLAERRGRQMFLFKKGKCFRDADAELAGDDFLHLRVRKRFDLVLQTRERLQIRFRQKIRAAGKQLAELDERRPHLFQIVGQFFGRGLAGFGGRRCLVLACRFLFKFLGQI